MANNYKRWLCEESLKTPSSRPILIYFEFRSKPSLITVICMNPQQTLICCDKIFSHTQRGYQFLFLDYFIIFQGFFCYFTFLLIFTKIFSLLLFYNIFFFTKNILIFLCSGMFQNVPGCSMFRVLSTPYPTTSHLILRS